MSQEPLTNDTTLLVPTIPLNAPRLEFNFPAFQVGVAEYVEGPTGCTVFHFPDGAATAIDIRGGSVGTIGNYPWNHAICLAGGSLYGLEAATGVAAELFALRGYARAFQDIALVSGAIIYDYLPRINAIYPDKQLGRAALKAAQSGVFPLGAHGAGCSAVVGKGFDVDQGEPAGQGGAFQQIGPTKIAVFTIVNARGAIINRQGQVIRGHLHPKTGQRQHLIDDLTQRLTHAEKVTSPHGNTTLTVVITNQKLDEQSLPQFARQVHTSMARAIHPFHTISDGDVLYAVSTNEVTHPLLNDTALGVVASEVAWDAILSSVQGG